MVKMAIQEGLSSTSYNGERTFYFLKEAMIRGGFTEVESCDLTESKRAENPLVTAAETRTFENEGGDLMSAGRLEYEGGVFGHRGEMWVLYQRKGG